MAATTLQPAELRFLEPLRLNPKRSFAGRTRGERLSKRKGISIEFADYREYAEGDDLRHLDWNVLARLDTTVMRTYQDEEDLSAYLLLDASPSMGFGQPTKWEACVRLGAAMGFVGLVGQDAVRPWLLGSQSRPPLPFRGRASFGRLWRWLDAAKERTGGLATGLKAFAHAEVPVGLAIVLSDGLDPDASAACRAVAGRGHEVWWIQVLSDTELDPDIEGDLRLVDSEESGTVDITASRSVLEQYKKNLRAHIDDLAKACRDSGGRHAVVRSSSPLEEPFRNVFRREGWVVR